MLNGGAHHSLIWDAEPRMLPLRVVKDGPYPKRDGP